MQDRSLFCARWDNEEEEYVVGNHKRVNRVILKDGYFVASEISRGMPGNQYVSDRDLEMVDFEIDISGDEITSEDVSSSSESYLNKFSGVYEGVAEYVQNLERIPVDRFRCPKCDNNVDFESDVSGIK